MADAESKPTPDPTILTTEQMLREVNNAVVLMGARLAREEDLCEEKFRSVDRQLDLVERQRVEQKKDTKDAVDAALTAQKEAVREQTTASDRAIAKSEASMTRQLEQLTTNFATTLKGVTDSLGDLKDRVGAIESVKQGGREQQQDSRQSLAGVYGLIGALGAVFGVIGLLAAAGAFGP